jgi:UDP-glucose 4-epimerase
MRIAITGGSGFIGRAARKWAERAGHEVSTFDRVDGNDIMGPLRGLDGAEHVIHLAGVLGTHELFDTPRRAIDINVMGALRILEWCRHHGAGYTGITMPDVFPSIYTATKVAADRLASAYHHSHGVPVSRVRAFNAHGPGQAHGEGHPQKILPTFAVKAWAGEALPIWGDGEQTVDLVTADDLGRMLVDATRFGDDAVFDGGTGQAVRVNEVVRFVARRVEVKGGPGGGFLRAEHLPMRRGEVPTHIVAKGEGWDRLDWRPEFSWDDVAATVDSYRPKADCGQPWPCGHAPDGGNHPVAM